MPLPSVNPSPENAFYELRSVDSTNNYALGRIHANLAQEGDCYFAHEQTVGRGQRGRTWHAAKGLNVTMSVVLQPQFLQLFEQFSVSACIAVAVHSALRGMVPEGLTIKWPNDIYWNDSKLAGILIENVVGNRASDPGMPAVITWSVAGIGVNVNQVDFPADIRNAASLSLVAGKRFEIVDVAKATHESVMATYRELAAGNAHKLQHRYNEHLYFRGRPARFRKGTRLFEAVVESVNSLGQLVIEHSVKEAVDHGSIEWVI